MSKFVPRNSCNGLYTAEPDKRIVDDMWVTAYRVDAFDLYSKTRVVHSVPGNRDRDDNSVTTLPLSISADD